MNYIGTCHFTSVHAANRYYKNYDCTPKDVKQKIKDGSIAIGPPKIKEGQTLSINREEGRYVIQEQD